MGQKMSQKLSSEIWDQKVVNENIKRKLVDEQALQKIDIDYLPKTKQKSTFWSKLRKKLKSLIRDERAWVKDPNQSIKNKAQLFIALEKNIYRFIFY